MKWVNLLWSIVLLGLITFFFTWLDSHNTGVISAGFGFAVIAWVVFWIISPIILFLRIFRIIKYATGFIYIFTGTANIAIGLSGLCFILHSTVRKDYPTTILLMINVLIGLFIFTDSFIITIPGYRRGG
jgi:hypothetical protein